MLAQALSPATSYDSESDHEILSARSVRIFRVNIQKASVPCKQEPDILRLSRKVKHELAVRTSSTDPETSEDLQSLLSQIRCFLDISGYDTLQFKHGQRNQVKLPDSRVCIDEG